MDTGETSDRGDRPWQSYHTVYTNAKAGMDGVDKEKVQKIVYEMSKGSKYFENEERKEAFIRQKMENMRAQCEKLTATDISHYQMVADKRTSELEATRDLSRVWLHVDMDAFYAAVETLANSSLRGKPMAVGSMSMISTANYEARKFGVRAAMPGFIALKLCPELIFVPTDFKKYTYYSSLTRKVFQKYDPNFMATSLDEAYLDITEVCKERGISSGEIAEELRTGVYEETGLTCSTGVGPNRMLAKMQASLVIYTPCHPATEMEVLTIDIEVAVCSDINKPNGQFVLPNDRTAVMTFISSVPIRKIGGIGKVTEHILTDVFGINTCEEMLQKSAFLCALFSRSSSDFFLSVGLGLGKTGTLQVGLRKSVSSERTFSATENEALLYQKLADIAETLSTDMQKEGLCGRTLTLKLKTESFEVRTRAVSLQRYICSSEDILSHGSKLLKAELPLSLRLIGLRMSHFNDDKLGPADPTQKTLTNFVISRDAPGKITGANISLGSDINYNPLMINTEIGSPIGSRKIRQYDSTKPSDSNQLSDLKHEHCALSNDVGEMETVYKSLSHGCEDKMTISDMVGHVQKSNETEVLQMVETTSISFSEHSGGSCLDKEDKKAKLLDDHDAILSLNQNEQCFWVDNYICSLCGIEMPPSFVEERLEHSDYHLAEMLQKKESGSTSRDLIPKQRFIQKAQVVRENKRRKHKSSPKGGKHIPIDLFFVKGGQNY